MYLKFAIAVIAFVGCLATSNLVRAQEPASELPIMELHAFGWKEGTLHRLDFEFRLEPKKMQVFHVRQDGTNWRVQLRANEFSAGQEPQFTCRGLVTMSPEGYELESIEQRSEPDPNPRRSRRPIPPKAPYAGYFFIDLCTDYLVKFNAVNENAYLVALKHPYRKDYVGVVCWIRNTEDPSAAIEAQLKKRNPPKDFVRGALAAGWRGKAGEKFVPALMDALADKTNDVFFRASAMDALGQIGPGAKEAVPLLTKELSSSEEAWRYHAIVALGKIGAAEAGTIEAIEQAAAKSDNKQFRAAAEEAIYSIKKAQRQAAAKRDMAT